MEVPALDWIIVCGDSFYGKNGKFVPNEWEARGFPDSVAASEFAKGMRCPWSVRERVQTAINNPAAAPDIPVSGSLIKWTNVPNAIDNGPANAALCDYIQAAIDAALDYRIGHFPSIALYDAHMAKLRKEFNDRLLQISGAK